MTAQIAKNQKLFQTAQQNYSRLVGYCKVLEKDGQWLAPSDILKITITQMLDQYVQSVLVNLAVYCGCFFDTQKEFVANLPEENILGCPEWGDAPEGLFIISRKISSAPPILLQLCGLYDSKEDTKLSAQFVDSMINIMLCMLCLDGAEHVYSPEEPGMKYIRQYYERQLLFLDSETRELLDERYLFRKLASSRISNEFSDEGRRHGAQDRTQALGGVQVQVMPDAGDVSESCEEDGDSIGNEYETNEWGRRNPTGYDSEEHETDKNGDSDWESETSDLNDVVWNQESADKDLSDKDLNQGSAGFRSDNDAWNQGAVNLGSVDNELNQEFADIRSESASARQDWEWREQDQINHEEQARIDREEWERLEREEQLEQERLEWERREQDRINHEEQARIDREEWERLEREEQLEQEQLEREERERREQEHLALEEQEQREREEQERKEQEEKERLEREEQERIEREEQERLAREEQERKEQEEKERLEREERERKRLLQAQKELELQQIKDEIRAIKEKKNQARLQKLLDELNSLVGLEQIKEEVNSLINLIKVRKMRKTFQMPEMDMTYHMVFTGNPGTGKTTVARLISRIYKELGILSEGTLVETDRAGLVAGFVGQTAIKVTEVVTKAIGGVLFIDEAYSLTNYNGQGDFGGEVIDTLVKLMEDHRDDLVVIVAGYKEEMKQFLASNTGLVSRFNKFMDFPDYTNSELMDILVQMADKAGVKIDEDALALIKEQTRQFSSDELLHFGNARGIRNLFEKIMVNQANRIVMSDDPTVEMLSTIILSDVEGIITKMMSN